MSLKHNEKICNLIKFIREGKEQSNKDLVVPYFRDNYKDFQRKAEASLSDGYVEGHFVLEVKSENWFEGFFQGIAYKNKNLDFKSLLSQ